MRPDLTHGRATLPVKSGAEETNDYGDCGLSSRTAEFRRKLDAAARRWRNDVSVPRQLKESVMAKGASKPGKEKRKPKAEKPKTIAAAPSRFTTQPKKD